MESENFLFSQKNNKKIKCVMNKLFILFLQVIFSKLIAMKLLKSENSFDLLRSIEVVNTSSPIVVIRVSLVVFVI
jgi:hypothetical protein